jgi:hypothetical protein
LAGTSGTPEAAIAQAVGGEEVSVSIMGAETSGLQVRTETFLSVFAGS